MSSVWSGMDDTQALVASCSTQRSLQKTSGQFNNDLAEVADVFSVEEVGIDVGTTFEAVSREDLYNMLKTEGDSLLDVDAMEESLNLDLDTPSIDFLENYTDLSTLFFKEDLTSNLEPMNMLMECEEASGSAFEAAADVASAGPGVTVADCIQSRKRKAAPVSVSSCGSDVAPDHSGYASRPKHARVLSTSSATSLLDDEDAAPPGGATLAHRDHKYKERRKKNNVASRRSRQTRKEKFATMEEKAIYLEAANEELRQRVTELEKLAQEMKDILVTRLAK